MNDAATERKLCQSRTERERKVDIHGARTAGHVEGPRYANMDGSAAHVALGLKHGLNLKQFLMVDV